MKLIIAIVNKDDASEVSRALTREWYTVTRLATSGGFLMAGNITNEIVGKLGIKNSSKGVRIAIDGDEVTAELYINIKYGFRITDVTSQIQDKVKTAIENMTGLKVVAVNIHVVEIIV